MNKRVSCLQGALQGALCGSTSRIVLVFVMVLVSVVPLLLLPSTSHSQTPNLKLYFDNSGDYSLCPYLFVPFDAYLIMTDVDYSVTAVEYRLDAPDANFQVIDISYPPEMSIVFGDPMTGHSISFWPPLYSVDRSLLICSMECMIMTDCSDPAMNDYPIVVSPNPDSGFLRGTYAPDHEFFDITGGTSYLCMHGNAPFLIYADAESELSVRASFICDIDNWYDEYPGGSYVLKTSVPSDTIWVVNALPIEENKKLYVLFLGSPLDAGFDYTLYVTDACTNGGCMDCTSDTRFNFYYEAPISIENSSWSRIKSLGAK
ncbi:MAG: hypothetical protein KAV42_01940 [Candidatus Krumholzibacteria bacterium]|nr:hypothetical protein [Candidatus Krumholzibacteria bacterium]